MFTTRELWDIYGPNSGNFLLIDRHKKNVVIGSVLLLKFEELYTLDALAHYDKRTMRGTTMHCESCSKAN